jgi:hypothetical protein
MATVGRQVVIVVMDVRPDTAPAMLPQLQASLRMGDAVRISGVLPVKDLAMEIAAGKSRLLSTRLSCAERRQSIRLVR